MKRLLSVSLVTAMIATAAFAQSRDKRLDINVTNSIGVSMEGVHYTLHTNAYDMDYSAAETVLDASGHSSVMTYPGSHTIRIALTGLRTYTATFDMEGDKTLDIALEEDITDPYSLHAVVSHDVYDGLNAIDMEWNKELAIFEDDFESYDAFTIDPQPWTGIDKDGVPAVVLAGEYPNSGKPQYIQIVNPWTVSPAWDLQYYYTMAPRSGHQYAAFLQPNNGNNNDWLISPQIAVGDDNCLRFYMRRADVGDARIKVGITTVENPSTTDFTTISAGNYLSPGYEDWEEVIISLADYAGQTVKIGFNCTSRNGAVMTMLDDIFVGRINMAAQGKSHRVPAHSPANPNEKFYIYLDGNKIAETTEYSYSIDDVSEGQHTVGVQAVCLTGSSATTEASVTVSNDNYAAATVNVTANNGRSLEGAGIAFDGPEGGYFAAITDGKASIISLPKGQYEVSADIDGYDLASITLDLSGDATADMLLKETIVKPFNITADTTEEADGTHTVVLNWNRDLGFTDSFEDYDDFATGTFGGWTTLNFNGEHQVSYPISFNGNEINFPGCSLSSAPRSVPPMVFNPLATRPSLADDGAFLAPDGSKYVAFMGPQGIAADKWLISPVVRLYDGYRFDMTAKGYPIYAETLRILISDGSTNPDDFVLIDEVVVPYNQWTQYQVDLSAYHNMDARLAVQCVTNDGFVAQVDDIRIAPAGEMTSQSLGFVNSYDVSLDASHYGNTGKPTMTLKGLQNGSHTFGVKANYATGSSEEAQYQLTLAGVDGVKATISSVIGGKGEIVISADTAMPYQVADMAGAVIATGSVEGTQRIAAAPGVYIVRLGNTALKTVVK